MANDTRYEERNETTLTQTPQLEREGPSARYRPAGDKPHAEPAILGTSEGGQGEPVVRDSALNRLNVANLRDKGYAEPQKAEPRDPQPVVHEFSSGEGPRRAYSPNNEFLECVQQQRYPQGPDLSSEHIPDHQVMPTNVGYSAEHTAYLKGAYGHGLDYSRGYAVQTLNDRETGRKR